MILLIDLLFNYIYNKFEQYEQYLRPYESRACLRGMRKCIG